MNVIASDEAIALARDCFPNAARNDAFIQFSYGFGAGGKVCVAPLPVSHKSVDSSFTRGSRINLRGFASARSTASRYKRRRVTAGALAYAPSRARKRFASPVARPTLSDWYAFAA